MDRYTTLGMKHIYLLGLQSVVMFTYLYSASAWSAVTATPNPSNGSYTVSWSTSIELVEWCVWVDMGPLDPPAWVCGETEYVFQEKVGSGSWTTIYSSGGHTSYSVSGRAGGSYQYRVCDQTPTGGCNVTMEGPYTVTVIPPTAPVAGPDSGVTNEDVPITLSNVLQNDTDANGDTLTITGKTNGGHGSVSRTSSSVTYTPNPNWHGTDTFTYTVSDPGGLSDEATVTITVNPMPDAPIAVDDSGYSVDEDSTVTISNVLSNDTDADGDALTITGKTNGTKGTVSISGGSNLVYTPHANENGTDTFTYKVEDTGGLFDNATVSVTIIAKPDAPVAGPDSAVTNEDVNVTISDILTNVSDVDVGDTHTVSSTTNGTHGTVTHTATSVTYDPDDNWHGTDTFTYTVKDQTDLFSPPATVTVTVNSLNDPPVAVNDSGYTTPEDVAVTITDVLDNDSDIDIGDTFSIHNSTNGSHGTVTRTDTTLTYTPNPDYSGTDTFTYTIKDQTDTVSLTAATVSITVSSVNDAPDAVDDLTGNNLEEDTSLVINVLANDIDTENDTLTIVSATDPGNGFVSINANDLTYTPDPDYSGSDTFTYTIEDDGVPTGSDSATVTVEVTNVNDAPILENNLPLTIDIGATRVIKPYILRTADIDNPDTDLVYTITTAPAYGHVALDTDPNTPITSFTQADINEVDEEQPGLVHLIYVHNGTPPTMDEGFFVSELMLSSMDLVQGFVTNGLELADHYGSTVSAAGDVNGDGIADMVLGSPLADPNGLTDAGETYVVFGQATGLPANIDLTSLDGTNGFTIQGAVAGDQSGFAVSAAGDLNGDGIGDILVGAPYADSLGLHDAGESYVIFGKSTGFTETLDLATLDGSNGFVIRGEFMDSHSGFMVSSAGDINHDSMNDIIIGSYEPDPQNPGQSVGHTYVVYGGTTLHVADSFEFSVTDGGSPPITDTFTITTSPGNFLPEANDDVGIVTNEDTTIEIDVLSNDTDMDGDALTIQEVFGPNGPKHGTATIFFDATAQRDKIRYQPDPDYFGDDDFVYIITDSHNTGSINSAKVRITVDPVNDQPVIAVSDFPLDEDGSTVFDLSVSYSDVEDDPFTSYTIVNVPGNGVLTINGSTVLAGEGFDVSVDGTLISYTPAANFNGNDTLVLTANDGELNSLPTSLSFTVNSINDTPVANNNSANTAEDNSITIDVVFDDTDVEDDNLVISSVTNGSFGTVIQVSDTTVRYTPNPNFHGADTFTYTIDDGNAENSTSLPATVSMTVTPVNDDPVANDDSGTTNVLIGVSIDVLGNDNDIDGDALTIESITQGLNGTVENHNTFLVYIPNPGFTGTDSFNYVVTDGISGSTPDTGQVTVTVQAPSPLFSQAVDPEDFLPSGAEYKGNLKANFNVGKDGSANYTIPIVVPPGINGMQPNLSLSYNSNRRNGLVGWGWAIGGLSAITRCQASLARDGYVAGINNGDSYRFCLNGQRLVEVATDEYRIENNISSRITQNGASWQVERPDGGVLQYGRTDNARQDSAGQTYAWYLDEIRDKAGNYLEVTYDKPLNSGEHRPASINYTKNDAAGATDTNHEVVFTYETGTRPDVIEKYVAGDLNRINKRLESIEVWTENSLVRSYQLAYEPYDGSDFADPVKTSRLASVQLCYDSLSNCADPTTFDWSDTSVSTLEVQADWDWATINPPGLTQSDINSIPGLAGYTLYDSTTFFLEASSGDHVASMMRADFNGDLIEDTLIFGLRVDSETAILWQWGAGHSTSQPTGNAYYKIYLKDGATGQLSSELAINDVIPRQSGPVWHIMAPPAIMDLNGDGNLDLLFVPYNSPYYINGYSRVFLGNGNGFTESSAGTGYSIAASDYSYNPTYTCVAPECVPTVESNLHTYDFSYRDFDGDGLIDVLRKMPQRWSPGKVYTSGADNNISVALNTGSGFGSFQSWANYQVGELANLDNEYSFVIGDVTGDGLNDLLVKEAQVVGINTGSSFNFVKDLSMATLVDEEEDEPKDKLNLADINGDGLADLIWTNMFADNSWQRNYQISTGTGFLAAQQISTASIGGIYRDFNSDGLIDIVSFSGSGGTFDLDVYFATGTGFTSAVPININPSVTDPMTISYCRRTFLTCSLDHYDVDKDGLPDQWGINQGQKHYMDWIEDGLGNTLTINYAPFAQRVVYTPDTSEPPVDTVKAPALVARTDGLTIASISDTAQSTIVSDAINRDSMTGAYGVGSVLISNGIGGTNTKTYHYHDARVHREGFGRLGFAEIEEIENRIGTETIKRVSQYSQEAVNGSYKLAGRLLKQEVYSNSQRISETVNKWKVTTYPEKDIDTDFDSPHYFPFLLTSTTHRWDLDNNYLSGQTRRVRKSTEPNPTTTCVDPGSLSEVTVSDNAFDRHDEFGNFFHVVTTLCDDNPDTATTTTAVKRSYIDDTGSLWFRGLVDDQETISIVKKGGTTTTLTRQKDFTYYSDWFLEQEITEPNDPVLKFTTTFDYDTYGHVKSMIGSWTTQPNDGLEGFNSSTTLITTTYDNASRKSIATTNPIGLQTDTLYNAEFGLPISFYDEDDLLTTTTYDAMGRVKTITRPDTTTTTNTYALCSGSCFSHSSREKYLIHTKETGTSPVRRYFDSYDRDVGSRSTGLTGSYIYTWKTYDALGRLTDQAAPFFSGDTEQITSFDYDNLDRLTKTTHPDNAFQTTSYSGTTTTKINVLGQHNIITNNAAGQVVNSEDHEGTIIDYAYHPFGDLKSTIINNNEDTRVSMEYDILGRKTRLTDPDTGVTTFRYNALNLVSEQTDNAGQVTRFGYDDIGRQIKRVDDATAGGAATRTHTWQYVPPGVTGIFGAGQLEQVSGYDTVGNAFTETHSYNNLGLLESTTTVIDAEQYDTSFHYDNFSRPVGTTYPSGQIIANAYNNFGYLAKLENAFDNSPFWTANTADARGNITQFTQGSGDSEVVTNQAYDDAYGRIHTIHVVKDGVDIQNHEYLFDSLGNLRERHDHKHSVDEYFCYDNLNRLEDYGIGGCLGTDSQTMTYDELGNIRSKTGIGSYDYTQSGNAGPHAVTSAGGNTYAYDLNGNVTSVTGITSRTVTYTPFGKPSLITDGGNSVEVIYGPDQNRIQRVDNDITTTTYVGGIYEKIGTGSIATHRHYIADIAVLILDVNGTNVTYQHRDHLGSVVAFTDASGAITLLANNAWGERLTDSWDNDPLDKSYTPTITPRGFTDHEHLDPVGLIHMNGRVYDPIIGRFVSADPIIQAPFNAQSYNRYSYVFNNPLSFTDPSGFEGCPFSNSQDGGCEAPPQEDPPHTFEGSCGDAEVCIGLSDFGPVPLLPSQNITRDVNQIHEQAFSFTASSFTSLFSGDQSLFSESSFNLGAANNGQESIFEFFSERVKSGQVRDDLFAALHDKERLSIDFNLVFQLNPFRKGPSAGFRAGASCSRAGCSVKVLSGIVTGKSISLTANVNTPIILGPPLDVGNENGSVNPIAGVSKTRQIMRFIVIRGAFDTGVLDANSRSKIGIGFGLGSSGIFPGGGIKEELGE